MQIVSKDGPGELPANTLVRVVGCLVEERQRVDADQRDGAGPNRQDGSRLLKTRRSPSEREPSRSKFVLTKLDPFVGQRMSVSGMLIGAGGADGLNVAVVNRVAATCP